MIVREPPSGPRKILDALSRLYRESRWAQVGSHVLAAWVVLELLHLFRPAVGQHAIASASRAERPAVPTPAPPPSGRIPGYVAFDETPPAPALPAANLRRGLVAELVDPKTGARVCSFPIETLPIQWTRLPGPSACAALKGRPFLLRVSGLVRVRARGPAWVKLTAYGARVRGTLGGRLVIEDRAGVRPEDLRAAQVWVEAGWVRLLVELYATEGAPGTFGFDINATADRDAHYNLPSDDLAH